MQLMQDGEVYMMHYMELMLYQEKLKDLIKERAKKVIDYVRNFLDESFPLSKISWKEISKIQIEKKISFII